MTPRRGTVGLVGNSGDKVGDISNAFEVPASEKLTNFFFKFLYPAPHADGCA